MRQDKIEKILKYPTKKKLLTILNGVVSLSMNKPTLDKNELSYLLGSLSNKELIIYDNYGKINNSIRDVIQYLNQLRLSIRNCYTHLFDISILAFTHANFTGSINKALEIIPDKSLKDQIGEILENKLVVYGGFHRYDKENSKLIVGTGKGSKTAERIIYYQTEATEYIAITKAGIDLLREYLSFTKLGIKAYKDLINEIETEIKEPPTPLIIPNHIKNNIPYYKINLLNIFPDYIKIMRDETAYNELKEKLQWKII